MAKKANENNTTIANVLKQLEVQLKELAEELFECPFCLENNTSDSSCLGMLS
jgi:hypothetical protein